MPPISIATQVHGYQQGHQLLASSIKLAKQDQSVIDRLSDVAGPLRPGEQFEPYLSAYPLPSGQFFILARTWQDLTVPRAGCVRTLSLVISTEVWATAPGLLGFVDLLDPANFPSEATSIALSAAPPAPLPPVPEFYGNELLEALFLEEAKPVAVFDAPSPELIAIRLLTALWPAMRCSFAVSTFALSPRKIEGRSFDLIFAPKDARSRFAEWGGRRIDARGTQNARHRWTGAIVDRVFNAPFPSLLADQEMRLIGSEEINKPAALRIALLWDELTAKVGQSPSAALGLLDIANSRKDGDPTTFFALQPILAEATERAARTMPDNEAWDFVGAITRKMHRFPAVATLSSLAPAAMQLAARSPEGAIKLLSQPDPHGALSSLLSPIAAGIGSHFDGAAEKALLEAAPEVFTSLITTDSHLIGAVAKSHVLVEHIGDILPSVSSTTFKAVRDVLLPVLVEDAHATAATPLIASLDAEGISDEVRLLSRANDFASDTLVKLVLSHARDLGIMTGLRDVLLELELSPSRDSFLRDTFSGDIRDLEDLLEDERLPNQFIAETLASALRRATANQFRDAFTDERLAETILQTLPTDNSDILWRAVNEINMPVSLQLDVFMRLPSESNSQDRAALASQLLGQILRVHFGGDESAIIAMLLNTIGEGLDGSWAVGQGLDRHLPNGIVGRNLVSFNEAAEPARTKIVRVVEELAHRLSDRYTLDLDEPATRATNSLFIASQKTQQREFLSAAARVLPTLLRSRNAPVSSLIATTFPPVYRELAKEEAGPDFLKFIPFMDWDRCKSARRELVDAFLASRTWNPADIALIGCHSGDIWKILRKVAKSYGGERYFERIVEQMSELPEQCATETRKTVAAIYADWPSKYDWRD